MPGDPVLVRTLRYFDVQGRVVMFGRSIYRGDIMRYAFSVPLNGSAASPPGGIPSDL
jgi:hypothetical protein